jgi:hypothetical protein
VPENFDQRFARLTALPTPTGVEERPLGEGERLLIAAVHEFGPTFANTELGIEVEGPIDVDALQRAIEEIVARHSALRTCYPLRDGRTVARTEPSVSGFFRFVDCRDRGLDGAAHEAALLRDAGFDITRTPLSKFLLVRLDERRHHLYQFSHHLVCDGRSEVILHRELSDLYRAYRAGVAPSIAPPRFQYRDIEAWERKWCTEEIRAEHRAFWRRRLNVGVSPAPLAGMRPRPDGQRSFRCGRELVFIDAALGAAFFALAKQRQASPMGVMLAVLALVLRHEGAAESTIAFYSSNRRRETLRVVGPFVLLLPLRLAASSARSFGDLLDATLVELADVLEHQDLAPSLLDTFGHPDGELGFGPGMPCRFCFGYDGGGTTALDLVDATTTNLQSDEKTHIKFDIELYLTVLEDDALRIFVEYNEELITREQLRGFLERYRQVLAAVLANPTLPLDEPAS